MSSPGGSRGAPEVASRPLVVNADDLGLHPDINRGIEQAFREGIVTSASLCTTGGALDDAMALIERNPELDVGVHLTLVEERPLSDPAQLGRLVNSDGHFPKSYAGLTSRALSGQLSRSALRTELRAQLHRAQQLGLSPSHLDAHQHVHLLPGVWGIVLDLAREHRIPWIRVPRFHPLRSGHASLIVHGFRWGLNTLSGRARRSLGNIGCTDFTPALGFSGRLTASTITAGLSAVPAGASAELVAHPGFNTAALERRYRWGFDWSGETKALTDPELRVTLEELAYDLTSFVALAKRTENIG